jgi:hypothetical protein
MRIDKGIRLWFRLSGFSTFMPLGTKSHKQNRVAAENAVGGNVQFAGGAQEIVFRICGDKSSGRLLGAQLIGHWKSEISKRVDIFATALCVWHICLHRSVDTDGSLLTPGGRNGRVCQAQLTEYCPFREAKTANRCSLTAHRIPVLPQPTCTQAPSTPSIESVDTPAHRILP